MYYVVIGTTLDFVAIGVLSLGCGASESGPRPHGRCVASPTPPSGCALERPPRCDQPSRAF